MFLTAHTIRRLIAELDPPLIDIVIPKDLEGPEREVLEEKREGLKARFIEGSCFDLELASIGQIDCSEGEFPFLGRDERMIPKTISFEFDNVFAGKKDVRLLCSRQSYLFQSLETINMPPWLCGFVIPRTSIPRAGGSIVTGSISPGFSGRITQCWSSPDTYTYVQKGFRFVSVRFALLIPDATVQRYQRQYYRSTSQFTQEVDLYSGIWGGDKLTTEGKTERGF